MDDEMSPIERAARALAGWTPNVTSWEDVCHDPKDAKALQASYHNNVRAVLQAIREPSEGMIEPAAQMLMDEQSPEPPVLLAEVIWQAMIDRALAE